MIYAFSAIVFAMLLFNGSVETPGCIIRSIMEQKTRFFLREQSLIKGKIRGFKLLLKSVIITRMG